MLSSRYIFVRVFLVDSSTSSFRRLSKLVLFAEERKRPGLIALRHRRWRLHQAARRLCACSPTGAWGKCLGTAGGGASDGHPTPFVHLFREICTHARWWRSVESGCLGYTLCYLILLLGAGGQIVVPLRKLAAIEFKGRSVRKLVSVMWAASARALLSR